MWNTITRIIIEKRIFFSIIIFLLTLFLSYYASKIELSYEYGIIVPQSDPDMIVYEDFRKTFGEDANTFIVGFKTDKLFEYTFLNDFSDLCHQFEKVKGVEEVIAIPTLKKIVKDTVNKTFTTSPLLKANYITNQKTADSINIALLSEKLYDRLIFNKKSGATLSAVVIDKKVLNSSNRNALIKTIINKTSEFSEKQNVTVHYGGLPYIRYINTGKFRDEFQLLTILSIIVTCIILFVLFRSFQAVYFTLIVIFITVVWSMGTIALLGYKITFLTGMIPALIVIISIPNCVYMLNQYHIEYRKKEDKVRAVEAVIRKIGFISFLTNINTAVGFFVLLVTDITVIYEFGMVAGIMSVATFIIAIVLIPALFMFLPAPHQNQTLHLDKEKLNLLIDKIVHWVLFKRRAIYLTTVLTLLIAAWGISRVKAIAYIVDDFPEGKTNVKRDLKFFETEFGGVMPLEILVNFHDKKSYLSIRKLEKLDDLEHALSTISGISATVSVNRFIKATVQAFYNQDTASFRLPTNSEKPFIASYLKNAANNSTKDYLKSMVDKSGAIFRVSLKVADLGTVEMQKLIGEKIKPVIDSVFKETAYNADITGTSLLFLKGNQYLIHDLGESLLMAFLLISIMMAFLFSNVRIIVISIVPNLIPLIITLGVMGLCGIRLKTSTAVIFSTSFGITIDSTIHYLSAFKHELKSGNQFTIIEAVKRSLRHSGISMVYTSGVLLFGFGIFIFSDFGQTVALGLLTCITLFVAILTNMILLPALLITFIKPKPLTSSALINEAAINELE